MNGLDLKLCDIQGRLFELFASTEFDIENLVRSFMNSEIAVNLDSEYNRMQWAGEEYLLEELIATCTNKLSTKKESISKDILYWMGYVYRYWHLLTREDSNKIYKQAPYETMRVNYLMFHTMAVELAIEDLKEIYRQKIKK